MVVWNPVEIGGAVIGGALIALSSTLNLYLFGRITGINGMLNTLVKADWKSGFNWKFAFILGLITIPIIFHVAHGKYITFSNGDRYIIFDDDIHHIQNLDLLGQILAGLLVGVGTRLGNGCTSGHGVCGIPRLSLRSIVATITFMLFAMLIGSVRYHNPFLNAGMSYSMVYYDIWPWIAFTAYIMGLLVLLGIIAKNRKSRALVFELAVSFVLGAIFGLGLMISGMTRITKVNGFLIIDSERWDPSLMFVMGTAVAINFVTFQYILRKKDCPVMCTKFSVPANKKVDFKLVLGSAIFGLGWGLGGLCPGPGCINFFILTHVIFWLAGFIVGQLIFFKEEAPTLIGYEKTQEK